MSSERDSSYKLKDKDFDFICKFVFEETGIVLNISKREMVYRRLTRITRERKLPSFSSYCEILRASPKQEKGYFINAITTNLTSFFRENHHFEYLLEQEIPKIVKNKQQNKRLRIWSSASSTGEEPYSIAMTVLEAMKPILSGWDAKILATDIDTNVLASGKSGIYDIKRIEDIPEHYKSTYFRRGTGDNSSQVRVVPELQKLITFKSLNLLKEWPMKGGFDIIFCRNVIIYFNKETQQTLFERYYQLLEPGGLLILGHSENLGKSQEYFENIGRTMFRKPANAQLLREAD